MSMKIAEAFQELKQLKLIFDKEKPEMAFEVKIVQGWGRPFRTWFREEVPGKSASKESGVYFIADMNETILYIGKAGANNLGAEIWGKFGAPNEETRFIKSSLAKWAPDDNYRQTVIDGNVLIAAAIIQPQEYASLAEVYLHIWCARNGGLPVLNKRIG